ncbi:hypothetical protein SCHPADRAFT_808959, partial [Schizopora paradoxa]
FPPPPLSEVLQHKIIQNYCNDLDPCNFHESGCAVCGALTQLNLSVPLDGLPLEHLKDFDGKFTRKERKTSADPILPVDGPVINRDCKIVCMECAESVQKRRVPKKSLANGLWLGDVPEVLKGLTFAEKILIARVR